MSRCACTSVASTVIMIAKRLNRTTASRLTLAAIVIHTLALIFGG
jgi:hypothetical protein